ncbi:hypothetical protein GCK32_003473 [Trichostrongylus colubriformis]|uniref:Uncharacterized protein n=1 Tax=Trichostrongylus colubriformis TaxID=6319 RepID=A0AAN8IMP4_TRICO
MSVSPEDCEIMVQIATSPLLISTLFIADFCCLVAVPLLVYWTYRIWKMKLMHFNTRLLLCFHVLWILVHVIGRSVLITTDLIMYLTPFTSGCQLLHTRAGCFYLRLPFNIAVVISNCSAIFVSIERLIATFRTKNYECGYKGIGFLLVFLQLLVGICLIYVMYSQTKINDNPVYYCQTTSTLNYMWTIYPYCAMLAMQLLAVLIFELAKGKNKRNSLSGADLSSRYQNEENLWTIKALKVYVYTNTSFTATYLIVVSIIISQNHKFAIPTYYALVDASSLQYIYALVLPIVFWYYRKNVHNQIRWAVNQNLRMDSDRLFHALRNQWNFHNLPSQNTVPKPWVMAYLKYKRKLKK